MYKQAIIADITDIRSQISARKMFRGFEPSILAITGILALVISELQAIKPEIIASSPIYLLAA